MMTYVNPNDTPEDVMKDKPDLTGLNYWQARARMRSYDMRLDAAYGFQRSREQAEKNKAAAAQPAPTPAQAAPAATQPAPKPTPAPAAAQTGKPKPDTVNPLVANARKRAGLDADTKGSATDSKLVQDAKRRAEAAKHEEGNSTTQKANPLIAEARRRAGNKQ